MTPNQKRCRDCRHYADEDGEGGWCYALPTPNGRRRMWISQALYDDFISMRGCASFAELRKGGP